jgi:hypothetical protein
MAVAESLHNCASMETPSVVYNNHKGVMCRENRPSFQPFRTIQISIHAVNHWTLGARLSYPMLNGLVEPAHTNAQTLSSHPSTRV